MVGKLRRNGERVKIQSPIQMAGKGWVWKVFFLVLSIFNFYRCFSIVTTMVLTHPQFQKMPSSKIDRNQKLIRESFNWKLPNLFLIRKSWYFCSFLLYEPNINQSCRDCSHIFSGLGLWVVLHITDPFYKHVNLAHISAVMK